MCVEFIQDLAFLFYQYLLAVGFNLLEEKQNFIKDIIKKQLDLAYISPAVHPTDRILNTHLHLMKHIYDSNFYKLLAQRIDGSITVRQFAEIFANLLNEVLHVVLIS